MGCFSTQDGVQRDLIPRPARLGGAEGSKATEMMDEEILKDGLDFLHKVVLLARGGKLFERRPPPKSWILDDITGTGIWAAEVAKEIQNEGGEVLGFATLNLQPTSDKLPINVSFCLEEREDLWRRQDQFGLIHTRVLPDDTRNWSEFCKMAYEHLTIEGTLEIEALSLELFSDCKALTLDRNLLLNYLNRATTDGDKEHLNFENTKQLLEDAGFRHVTETITMLPINPWDETNPRRQTLGSYFNVGLQFLLGVGQFTPPGRDPSPKALQEIYDPSHHAYCRL